MTEQEAEVFARLKRVWGAELMRWNVVPDPPRANEEGYLYLYANLPHALDLHVDGCLSALSYFCLEDKEGDCGLMFKQGQLDHSVFLWTDAPEKALAQTQFAAQWFPFFRRGCWLSGCPIEATAYEKAEWIQDFSPEELQAWNLKM